MKPITRAQLPGAIQNAPQNATLCVVDETVQELGERAAQRMGRPDLTFAPEGKMPPEGGMSYRPVGAEIL